jgi:hypothetical protein
MGCYGDLINSTRRDMDMVFYDDETTIESCIKQCYNMGYLYSGLENR